MYCAFTDMDTEANPALQGNQITNLPKLTCQNDNFLVASSLYGWAKMS